MVNITTRLTSKQEMDMGRGEEELRFIAYAVDYDLGVPGLGEDVGLESTLRQARSSRS